MAELLDPVPEQDNVPDGTLGILVGLKAEAKLARPFFPGAAIAISGATSAGAAHGAARLVASGATALLSFGLAAGLHPELAAGVIVIPDYVSVGGKGYRCDMALRMRIGGMKPESVGGGLLHSDEVVLTAEAKALLLAKSRCAALDMESGFVARAAIDAGIPFAALRVVCDPATRTLPPAAGIALSPDGGLGMGALLGSLLRGPGQIPALIGLGVEASRARAAMLRHLASLG